MTEQQLPPWKPGLNPEVYAMFKIAIVDQNKNVEEALTCITSQPEFSNARKGAAERIASYLREALVG
jgi:hypothetical protein